ncbi:(deoxy)nucleoside triphosphate pyrophosphohydrolase [Pseudodesulfovibrio senegalensis]|jgi:8-oxo-dGTP diphosphatase|uniref:8-oxo-dGTP diphosphatase n=1 Tax=Pseudodesulfovibrio senegalensis TaxID=1721087 RepID=A0A6N6N8L2_9BACT|nr:(deoxy)nucleoside triphosphate pyrophosphohydrolase [Pseudodesulfovibrio senegalensis]KAB1443898.1 (deoxy)nucleoside triphosphate pyrophosphohydrolase [Pseudodesulfovibrio senegalensis]
MKSDVMEVVAGILWDGDRYLAVERPQGTRMAGRWEFPGGKIDAGETREQALVRELREELGIECLHTEFWREVRHDYAEFPVRLHFFHVHEFEGPVRPMEGQRMVWVLPCEGTDLNFLEADIEIVEALKSR